MIPGFSEITNSTYSCCDSHDFMKYRFPLHPELKKKVYISLVLHIPLMLNVFREDVTLFV